MKGDALNQFGVQNNTYYIGFLWNFRLEELYCKVKTLGVYRQMMFHKFKDLNQS